MAPMLIQQLDDLGRQVQVDLGTTVPDWEKLAREVDRLTRLAIEIFQQLENARIASQPPDRKDWNEAAAREFIPVFTNWLAYANELKALRRECKSHGRPPSDAPDFFHAINRSKSYGPEFDNILNSFRRFESGEEKGRPLQEVKDELRHRTVASGQ